MYEIETTTGGPIMYVYRGVKYDPKDLKKSAAYKKPAQQPEKVYRGTKHAA